MQIPNLTLANPEPSAQFANATSGDEKLREAFDQFVGQTFFGQMLASLRSAQKESAYFHGGQAERIFQGQLDQVLVEDMTKSSAEQFSAPMFELFQLQRRA
jgi:peptidoglycan hydrolase FlgJ